jgi:sulfite oxidase
MHVKWLSRLRLESQESVNHNQAKRYRAPREPLKPGSTFDYRFDNSDSHWRMKIKSVTFSPDPDAMLRNGKIVASGVAWNDGTSAIDAVELSIDGGQSWRRTELERAGRYAWQHWQMPLELSTGAHTLISRAVDTLGNTQPLDGTIDWNPDGYLWHGADRVTVRIES